MTHFKYKVKTNKTSVHDDNNNTKNMFTANLTLSKFGPYDSNNSHLKTKQLRYHLA